MLITSSILLDLSILLAGFLLIAYRYFNKTYKYWENRGVNSPKAYPLVGNFLDVILLKTTLAEWLKSLYDKVNDDFFGVYIFDEPFLVVRDPKLIKHMLVKDFRHFIDRNIAAPAHSPVIAHMLFTQKNPGWRYGRTKLTSAFTSGKLRGMFPILTQCADVLKDYLVEKNKTVVEAKNLVARYTTDVIARCVFGMDSKSFEPKDSSFTVNRKLIFDFSLRNAFVQSIYFFKPSWVNKFKLEFVKREALDYFTDSFIDTMHVRSENKEKHNDLVDIMLKVKKGMNVTDGTDDATFCGAALQFFLAGFETMSTTISYILYEFAIKPDIQKRVREEMHETIEKYGGITYDSIKKMTFLDQCITESLRRYPVLPFIERRCTDDYKIPNTDITIEKGTPILFPMYALQMDDQYFPEPFTYDPDRFETPIEQNDGIFLFPFGEGPRRCIGDRFARMGAKLALISVINNYEVTRCSTTPDPIVFEPKSVLLQSNVGVPIKFTLLQ